MKEIIEEKQRLRKIFQQKRSSLSLESKDFLSKLIAENFINFLKSKVPSLNFILLSNNCNTEGINLLNNSKLITLAI